MEELRQASVELVGTADHMGCGVQHLLQFLGRSFRHTWLSGDLSDVGAADFCNAVHPEVAADSHKSKTAVSFTLHLMLLVSGSNML